MLDLFSGCGGLSLGFDRAGFTNVGGIEIDPIAARTHARNFHRRLPDSQFDAHAAARDITVIDALETLTSWGHRDPRNAVDVIVGGPPCPAFARVGRAKLREIHAHPEAFLHDPRARLYQPYLKWVEELAPMALVMENVPDLLNFAGQNLGEQICVALERLGYRCTYTLLNAASYGVPQMRERFFLVAVHEALATAFVFPEATRRVDYPVGYEGTRSVALKGLAASAGVPGIQSAVRYVPSPRHRRRAEGPVTAMEALEDLPEITRHLVGLDKRGARRFSGAVRYREGVVPSRYANEIKHWPRFATTGTLADHVTRCLSPRDYRIFAQMRPGDQYPEAVAIAHQLLEEALLCESLRTEGESTSARGGPLMREYVPPYDPSKFPNKWRKMAAGEPARTLMAHLGKDTYSHIHYDSSQARTITVREAARLQSFPDGFVFDSTMNPAFRMIGNSVPPLLAFAIAAGLRDTIVAAVGCRGSETTSVPA